jgi:hypothetical protein
MEKGITAITETGTAAILRTGATDIIETGTTAITKTDIADIKLTGISAITERTCELSRKWCTEYYDKTVANCGKSCQKRS